VQATETSGRAVGGRDGGRPGRRGGAGERRRRVGAAPAEPGPGRPRPVQLNRNRLFYGVTEPLGIRYTYDYEVTYAGAGYERKFFSTLSRLARPRPLDRAPAAVQRPGPQRSRCDQQPHIDAPTVERWLALHPPAGVDTRQDTIFFVNWYGRPDFKFHVYTKTDEPDPDTGFNFGVEAESRKLIAWGGTTPDDEENVSAGPESWTDNWNVDDADVDGDGVADYRMPPIWDTPRAAFGRPRPCPATWPRWPATSA
jgi:hypothetical protein